MRISDWSSDVCSSDLPISMPVATRGCTSATSCSNAHQISIGMRCVPANDVSLARRPGAAARSEEHTSELQSLMRISYAVFCLKKKKIPKARVEHGYTQPMCKYKNTSSTTPTEQVIHDTQDDY